MFIFASLLLVAGASAGGIGPLRRDGVPVAAPPAGSLYRAFRDMQAAGFPFQPFSDAFVKKALAPQFERVSVHFGPI